VQLAALITCALHTLHVETAERRTALSETGLAEKATSAVKIMATFVVYLSLLFQILVYLMTLSVTQTLKLWKAGIFIMR
jgi:hypothetical protein